MGLFNDRDKTNDPEVPQEGVEASEELLSPTPEENEDRSAFNCPDCGGEGLKSQIERCPTCEGTGKVN